MTTRLYFPYEVYAPAAFQALSYDAAWEVPGNVHNLCSSQKANTSPAFYQNSKTTASQPYDVAIVQYVSPPLAAQTLNGTVKGQFRVYETASAQFSRALVIRVVSADGLTVRGTLLSHFPSTLTSEWFTSPKNRSFPPASTSLTEVICEEGDRLVIELGFRSFDTDGDNTYTGYFEAGDLLASADLPENETETDPLSGWLEFSQSLVWSITPYAMVGSGGVLVAGRGVFGSSLPTTYAMVGSGGVKVAGAGIFGSDTPTTLALVGDGGILVAGRGIMRHIIPGPPSTYAMVGSGGVKVSGQGSLKFVPPVTQYDLALVGSGGVEVAGNGNLTFVTPPVYAMVGSGGVKVGEIRVPELTVLKFIQPSALVYAVVASGGVVVGGEGIWGGSKPPVYAFPGPQAGASANILVGGAGCFASIIPQVLELVGSGEILVAGAAEVEGIFDTLVITGLRNEPSLYSNFNFNSYAIYQGQAYGAQQDGIYLLEGEDDAGAEIHSGVRIGPANFGTDAEKRLRVLRCGGDNEGARVKVSADDTEAYTDLEQGRAWVPRNVQGREVTVEIADFKTLDHFELIPYPLQKR